MATFKITIENKLSNLRKIEVLQTEPDTTNVIKYSIIDAGGADYFDINPPPIGGDVSDTTRITVEGNRSVNLIKGCRIKIPQVYWFQLDPGVPSDFSGITVIGDGNEITIRMPVGYKPAWELRLWIPPDFFKSALTPPNVTIEDDQD